MNYINKPDTALVSLTISQAKIAIPAIFGHLFDNYEYKRDGHCEINGFVYDIYKVNADGKEFTFYEDISAFYGRGNIIPNLMERDMPVPDQLYPLEIFLDTFYQKLSDHGARIGVNISEVKVKFKRYASNMVSNYIAAYYPDRKEIDVTPVKEYDNKFDFPILHSYNLYKLFILHQILHIVTPHDFQHTEIELRGNYQPKIGIECTQFVPITRRTHVNEFVNYMLWLHKPGAFKWMNECFSFWNCALWGVKSNLFTKDELIESIKSAQADDETEKQLIETYDKYFV